MNTLIAIPARFASTRLPAKPLKDINGKTLIERVWQQACKAKNCDVYVASDDQRIIAHAKSFSAQTLLTSDRARTGSDRVAECLEILEAAPNNMCYQYIANVQGDMPFINPLVIERAIMTISNSKDDIGIVTVATPIYDNETFQRKDTVKVVLGAENRALYFSRQAVPHARDGFQEILDSKKPLGFKHIGLYVFKNQALKIFSSLTSTEVEEREKLEQLRALAHGIGMQVTIIEPELMYPSIEVDTEQDLENAIKYAQANSI